MEHLPVELIGGVFDAIAQHCRPATSFTIHAIDHVLLGAGTADHLARLRAISRCLGLDEEDLDEVLGQIQEDPDAYFLSAEAHNRWRDNLPYLSFPMRRCVSIQICAPVRQDVRPASYAPDMRTQIDPVQELAMPEVQERLTQLATYFGVSSAMHNEDFLFRFMRDQTPGVESVERYFSSGSSDARRISNTIITLLPDVSNPKVLDFAAGFGRVSRHLTIIAPNLELETCDIHPNAVAFSRSQLHLRSFCSNYWPREDTLERESYNFIFALSFFSHIPNELFTDWLRLLYNSLKIGGILLFTTHGEASISLYPNLAELYDSRLGFGYYRSSDQHEINGGIYGTSVTDSRYVLRQITKAGAKLLGFQSAAWWGHQDEWTIRKVADPQGS